MRNSKEAPPSEINIQLGVPIYNISTKQLLNDCKNYLRNPIPQFLTFVDFEFVIKASRDDELKHILFRASRVLCKSKLLHYLAKFLKKDIISQPKLSKFLDQLMKLCERNYCSIYLFGSTANDIKQTLKHLKKRYPKLIIAGSQTSERKDIFKLSTQETLNEIAKKSPHLVLVALGSIQQERWTHGNYKKYFAPLTIPIGNDFSALRGHEPSELFHILSFLKRPTYFFGPLLKDFRNLLSQILRQKKIYKHSSATTSGTPPKDIISSDLFYKITWTGSVRSETIHELTYPPDFKKNVVCLCAEVAFTDSAGLGQMVYLAREAKTEGKLFCLLRPTREIKQLIEVMRLDKLIPIAENGKELKEILNNFEEALVMISLAKNGHDYILKPLVDLKQKSLEKLDKDIKKLLPSLSKNGKIILNLKHVDFIDNNAIESLLRIKNDLNAKGIAFTLTMVQSLPLKTLEILKLNDILIEPIDLEIV